MYKTFSAVRASVLVWLTHHLALPILQCIRQPPPLAYTKQDLQNMPAGSLGNDLIRMLDKNGFEWLPYYIQHDAKHIVLEYDTTGEGEVCLQCFMLGNGRLSFPVAATVFFGIVTMPEYWALFAKAYKRGSRATSLQHWQWPALLHMSTQSLKDTINATAA